MSDTITELVDVLRTIAGMASEGRAAFDADPRQRWAIERLWIFAGNLAERHCREADIDDGVEPWSELIATRNVFSHYIPSAINYERVWTDTMVDTPRLFEAVSAARHRE